MIVSNPGSYVALGVKMEGFVWKDAATIVATVATVVGAIAAVFSTISYFKNLKRKDKPNVDHVPSSRVKVRGDFAGRDIIHGDYVQGDIVHGNKTEEHR